MHIFSRLSANLYFNTNVHLWLFLETLPSSPTWTGVPYILVSWLIYNLLFLFDSCDIKNNPQNNRCLEMIYVTLNAPFHHAIFVFHECTLCTVFDAEQIDWGLEVQCYECRLPNSSFFTDSMVHRLSKIAPKCNFYLL